MHIIVHILHFLMHKIHSSIHKYYNLIETYTLIFKAATQSCRYVDCLMTVYENRFQLFIKNMFGFSNLICCIFFFWSLKHFESQSQSAAMILVPITPSVSIANEMAITLCTVDASICSIYYTYIFGQKSPTNIAKQQPPVIIRRRSMIPKNIITKNISAQI
uniref:Uncharacterized protein n=1 Tax=Meloidogyne enterolobii TaxID=390850 RepID=A0A6V7XMC3_MELEN|nr:unnamed protein product [Meloidogyne enterolobii]